MRTSEKYGVMLLSLLLGTTMLVGCDAAQKYADRMALTAEQKTQAKPIILEHAKRQDKLIESIKNQRPQGGPGGGMQGGGMQGGGMRGSQNSSGQSGRPDESQMKAMMEKKKAEMEKKFEENDQFAVRELEKFLSEYQINVFKTIAKEIRDEKIEELESERQNNQSGRGGGQGGRGGGGMGGRGGGMGGF